MFYFKRANNSATEGTAKNQGADDCAEKDPVKSLWKKIIFLVTVIVIMTVIAGCVIYYTTTNNINLESFVNLEKAVEENELEKITVYPQRKYATFKVSSDDKMHKAFYEDEYRLLDLVSTSGAKVIRSNFNIWWIVESALLFIVLAIVLSSMGSLTEAITKAGGRSISNSKYKSACVSKKITFKDIVGLEEIKERLSLVAGLCKESSKAPKDIRVPRGILFDGSPGNGKTMLAKAFANECGMHFIAVNSSDILKPFVGESERMINNIFDEAKEKAPSVIFFDEFDAIGSKRSANTETGAGKGYNSLVNALLTQLDGVDERKKIIVMAATNTADALDTALIRPGRFDMRLTVTNPDKADREALLRQYMHKSLIDNDVELLNLIALTDGMSCAQIETICNEAKISAFARNSKTISNEDFNSAILAASTNGLVKKGISSEAERYNAAIHEAGHAIAAEYHSRKKLVRVSIIPTTSGIGGYTETTYPDEASVRTLNDIRNELVILYGGKAAESLLRGDPLECSLGASNDIQVATRLAAEYIRAADGVDYSVLSSSEILTTKVTELIKRIQEDTELCLKEHWNSVISLAEQLMNNGTIITK